MNREIKFRAYDKKRKEYLSAGKILISIEPGERPTCSVQYLDTVQDPNKYANRFVIEQFTGLCDKNGKEIYEHDLIQDEEGVIYEIWYSEEKACFMAEMVSPQNDMVDILGCYDAERCFEIIGNKFDNPELLKGGAQ